MHGGSELMDQLSHAPVCIAVAISDVVLGKAIDEDGAQRLVLAVIGGGIGIQEETSAAGVIHGWLSGVRWFPAASFSRESYQKGSPRPT